MNSINPCTATPEPEKHVNLHDAITGINSIVSHLDELIQRISGPTPQSECNDGVGVQVNPPTLSDVLCHSPPVIRDVTTAAHDRITQIQGLLF